jgi:hypothetical protein
VNSDELENAIESALQDVHHAIFRALCQSQPPSAVLAHLSLCAGELSAALISLERGRSDVEWSPVEPNVRLRPLAKHLRSEPRQLSAC